METDFLSSMVKKRGFECPISLMYYYTCLDTRQPGSAFKKLDTRQSEILTNFLQIARLIPLRT